MLATRFTQVRPRRFSLALSLLVAGACTKASPRAAREAPAPAAAVAAVHEGAFAGMDPTVAPGNDFFAYANGSWLKSHGIPADRSNYGVDAELAELTLRRTADLIAETTRAAAGDADAQKIGDYYASFMDEATIEGRGLAPLQPLLAEIAAIADARSLARALGRTLRADVDVLNSTHYDTSNLLGLWVAQDFDDPTQYSPFLLQGGLLLPDRDYYLDSSPRMVELQQRYRAHIARILTLAGIAEPTARAARIFDLERRIAQAHVPRVETEDVQKGNNHWTRQDFDRRAPGLDWQEYFRAAGLEQQPRFVVWQPAALIALSALVKSQPRETWKDFLTFHLLAQSCRYLPKAFVDESFALYGKLLSGTPRLPDRWKRAVHATDEALGEAVGRLYVKRYFPPAEKARAEQMVRNELQAFARRIDQLAWMSSATKERAKAKLAVLKVGVGYPDTWRDYSQLQVVRGDALGNARRASLFDYQRSCRKLGRPVDRSEWVMNPHLVNAVNLPAMNALNFPAAILQPPYFDAARPAAMDYGAIGATIGHEISHSFDEQGALFDATGRLSNWWTPEDLAHFQASAAQLVRQYDAYRPFPDAAVNGKLTVSENIADLAGLAAAFDAYHLSLSGQEAPRVQGWTGDQQFFISFAQSWRTKTREPALRQRLLTDTHAPAEFRADVVRNLDAWYDAFAVKPGQGLYLSPSDRVRLW